MAFNMTTKRCEIFEEFTDEEQKEYFSLSREKVLYNIDTFYYTVYFDEEHYNSTIKSIIDILEEKKLIAVATLESQDFLDLELYPFGKRMYAYRLSSESMFDIYICKDLISSKNPRVFVQLRSIGLWLDGVASMIESSFKKVCEIFRDIPVLKVNENRIDYAFHINAIQDTTKYFSDENMIRHLRTSFSLYHKVGKIKRDFLPIDYLSLGSRSSNSCFFRAYNKSREVVEQNYKGFFFDYWHKKGLISTFDKYCYELAYAQKSYNFVDVARILWYLEFGKNETLKDYLNGIYTTYQTKSINYDVLSEKINGILPPVTQIINVEFETKRKFYDSVDFDKINFRSMYESYGVLSRLFDILHFQGTFTDYLTSKTVSFYDNSKNDYCYWWKRIRSCKIMSVGGEIKRQYQINLDIDKIHNTLIKTLSTYSIYSKKVNNDSLTDDFTDYLSFLNDNHVKNMNLIDMDTGEVIDLDVKVNGYEQLKIKKSKKLKCLLESD